MKSAKRPRDCTPQLTILLNRTACSNRLGFSAFASDGFAERIRGRTPSAMIVCGVETDVCVLSTILSAVDQGIRTIVPIDAVASASPSGHDAVLNHVLPRYDHQVELCTADEAIKALEAI